MRVTRILGLIGIGRYCVSAFGSVFADDCQWALGSGSAEAVAKLGANTYYDPANIKTAVQHLQQYCRGLSNTKSSTVGPSTASSPYLYDHLIDIGWRALDAEPSNPYGLKLDPAGVQWQQTLESLLGKADGDIPLKLKEAFEQQRKLTEGVGSSCEYYAQTRPLDGLLTKYLSMCELSSCIEQSLLGNPQGVVSKDSIQQQCRAMAMRRYQQEVSFVKSQLVIMGTAYMSTAIDAYLQGYLTQGRTTVLLENMSQFEQYLSNIARKVTGTQQCN